MSWEPSLVREDGAPLGASDDVRAAITRAFPGTEWELTPGGEDLLREMLQFGGAVTDDMRAHILQTPPHWHGSFETSHLNVDFNLGPTTPTSWVNVTARGDQAAARQRLHALAAAQGWHIKGDIEV